MFKTLDDLKKDKNGGNKDDKKDKKTTSSYAGGEKSGLAIENPNDAEEIINRAKNDTQSYSGGGTSCKITLYRNGFQIDDGPFRDYNDPASKTFMEDLKKGNVPAELRNAHKNGLDVELNDKRGEDYVEPPPPKYVAFSGQGTSLGAQTQTQTKTTTTSKTTTVQTKKSSEPPKIDSSKPTTKVQLRLHDGKVQEVEVNLDSSVQVLYDYAMSLCPADKFTLMGGFPPKAIVDYSQTIEEAGLEDSKVIQKV